MFRNFKKIIIRLAALTLVFCIEVYRKFNPEPARIYFCYNQSIHQIYHSIFIAIQLSNIQKDYEVVVLSTSKEASDIIEEEIASIPNNVKFIKIKHPGYNKIDFSINWFVFLCRLRMHKPKAVVVTDYYDNVFRQLGLKTFWVYVGHGGRIHKFAFEPHIKEYDLVIVPSEKILERLENEIGVLNNYVVIGYSKFDYFKYHKPKPLNLFRDSKPVVLYNPHFKPGLSSFFDKGFELLSALSDTGNYNVIFMPHPDLSRKYPALIKKCKGIKNVVIAERPKSNLDYMAVSDVYISDVSSSVYEWLYYDKPAVFFNAKHIDWRNNRYYQSWNLGEVVENISDLLDAIEYSLHYPRKFQQIRQTIFGDTFPNVDKNVSGMIANLLRDKIKETE